MPTDSILLYESVYGVSPEVSIRAVEPEVGPWLVTIKVTEFLTKKPIEGAEVLADIGERGTTDTTGSLTLTLTGGNRTLTVSKTGYWTKTGTRLITEDTTIDISLIPIWMIAAGGFGAGAVVLVALWALKRK